MLSSDFSSRGFVEGEMILLRPQQSELSKIGRTGQGSESSSHREGRLQPDVAAEIGGFARLATQPIFFSSSAHLRFSIGRTTSSDGFCRYLCTEHVDDKKTCSLLSGKRTERGPDCDDDDGNDEDVDADDNDDDDADDDDADDGDADDDNASWWCLPSVSSFSISMRLL